MPGGAQKRRLGLALIGLVLVAGAAFGFWLVLQSLDERRPYVVAARDIARWEVVGAADFRLVEANTGDAAVMTAPQMGAIYGQWTTGPIAAGTFITPSMFRQPPLSSEAEARSIVIQVSLPAEDVSYGALETGDTIALIGREPPADPAQAFGTPESLDVGFAPQETPLSLIGVLQLDNVQGDSLVYVVTPAEALEIQRVVRRYLSAADRQIWRLGFDLTADDVVKALDSAADVVNNN